MAYNGSGTFLINTAGQPVVAGTVISSTTFNSLTADLATGLSTVITKDGQTTVTANIPMASFKFTGLGVGSAAGDSANLSQVQSTVTKLLTSVSGTDTITAVGAPVVAAYVAGQMFYFVATGDNTTSVTINIDGLGAKAVTRDGSVALVAGDIKSGEVVVVVYDGTRFQVVSQLNSAGNATFANVSITSALNVGGVATFAAGSAAAPSITTTGDTNTGIWFPAADTIAFTEGGVESLRITSSADVGIGTTSPGGKLDVKQTTDTSLGGIYVRAMDNNAAVISRLTTGNLVVRNGGIDSLFLDSSGNLGLGVTPSAWGSVWKAQQLQTGAFIASQTNASDIIHIGTNAFANSSNAWTYINTAAATRYQQYLGAHSWYNAASGTAGNAITFTQAMTLDASGNLLVGATSAVSARNEFRLGGNGSGSLITMGRSGTNKLNIGVDSTDNVDIENTANTPIRIYTNSTERCRITAAGELLIGNTSLSAKVAAEQSATNSAGLYAFCSSVSYTSNVVQAQSASTGTGFNLYRGLADVSTEVYVVRGNGNVLNTNGSYGTISDAKMKTNIVDAGSQWNDLKAVRFRKFKMKDDPQQITQLGVVAQELEQTSPGLVDEHADRDAEGNDLGTTTKSVKSSILLMKAAIALQEAMARIEQLEAKFAALESK